MDSLVLGEVTASIGRKMVDVEGETFSNGRQSGSAVAASVKVPDGAVLEVGVVAWASGDTDVRTFTRLTGPVIYDRLTKGVRLGVSHRDEIATCELGVLSFHPDKQPTVIKASLPDLDQLIGGSVHDALMALGALDVGSREEIYGDTSRRRSYQAVTFPADNSLVPLAAYVVTRVVAMYKGFGRVGVVPVSQA